VGPLEPRAADLRRPRRPGRPGSHRPVSLLDVYPTILDLCGLPDNPVLEGESLRPLLDNPAAGWRRPALILLLGNNHAVQGERFRLIRWNDGSEELYDHQSDPHEHHNLATDPAHAAIKAELESALPTNLKSSGFRTRFAPNRGTPQEYLDELMSRAALRIHDQPVIDTHTTVEGMSLASSIESGFINLELVPAGPFGSWRETWFSSRELRDLAVSGSTGNASNDPFPNLAKYALGLDPKRVNPGLQVTLESHNGMLFPQLAFERSAARTDIDIYVELSTTLAADDWTVISPAVWPAVPPNHSTAPPSSSPAPNHATSWCSPRFPSRTCRPHSSASGSSRRSSAPALPATDPATRTRPSKPAPCGSHARPD